jgi:hypothetical protein
MCDAPQVYALQQKVNSVFYIEVLMCIKGSIQQKMSRQWRKKWILHHNNALSHLPHSAVFGAELNFNQPHPQYSPHLSPCNFYLFLSLKNGLKCHCLASEE